MAVIKPNQSLKDVVLATCGSVDALMRFCADNDFAPSDILAAGTDCILSSEAVALGDGGVVAALYAAGVVPGTLGIDIPKQYLLNNDGRVLSNDDGRGLEFD